MENPGEILWVLNLPDTLNRVGMLVERRLSHDLEVCCRPGSISVSPEESPEHRMDFLLSPGLYPPRLPPSGVDLVPGLLSLNIASLEVTKPGYLDFWVTPLP